MAWAVGSARPICSSPSSEFEEPRWLPPDESPELPDPDDDVTICCLRAAKGSSLVDEFERSETPRLTTSRSSSRNASFSFVNRAHCASARPWADWMAPMASARKPSNFSPSLNASRVAAATDAADSARMRSRSRRCSSQVLRTALRMSAVFRERASRASRAAWSRARWSATSASVDASRVDTYEAKRSANFERAAASGTCVRASCYQRSRRWRCVIRRR